MHASKQEDRVAPVAMGAATNRWWVVIASASALVVGQGVIGVFAAGVFLKPLSQELGFGRGVTSTALGLANLTMAAVTPFFGRLIDARGVRNPLLLSIALYALTTASLALVPASVVGFYLLFAITGLVGVGQNPAAYSKVIASLFDDRRGFALAVALVGPGIGAAVVPLVSNRLIERLGWRLGYIALAFGILLFAFAPVWLCIRDPKKVELDDAGRAAIPGWTLREARADWRFWAMLVAFFLAAAAINGSLIHAVSLLTDRGIPAERAVALAASAGIALTGGRVVAGWLADYLFAPYIGAFFLFCPAVGLVILALRPEGVPPVIAILLLGAGVGAEIDLLSYLVSRYFGVRHFGEIYGWLFSACAIGIAAGGTAMGWTYQLTNTYVPALLVFSALLVVAAGLLLPLGTYRYPPTHRIAERKE